MCKVLRTVAVLVLAVVSGVLIPAAMASEPELQLPAQVQMHPLEMPDPYGWVTMSLSIELQPSSVVCDTLRLRFIPEDGLLYDGPESAVIALSGDSTYSTEFSVFVSQDTSNVIGVKVFCDEKRLRHRSVTFLTWGDSLVYVTYRLDEEQRRRPVKKYQRVGNIEPGEAPKWDSIQGIPAPPDETADRQEYTRQLIKCINDFPDETIYDVFLELDNPSKLELAQLVTDALSRVDESDTYLSRAKRETIETLSGGGIWIVFRKIHLQMDMTHLPAMVPRSMRKPLLDSTQMAPLWELEKTPLTDSAMEIVTVEGFQFFRERGERQFGYYGREILTITPAELRQKEQEPLTAAEAETYRVNGVVYQRERGDTLFYRRGERRRGKTVLPPSNEQIEGRVPTLIDLRWSDELDVVQRFAIDSLIETAAPGIYRTVIDQTVADSLRWHNIEFTVSGREHKTASDSDTAAAGDAGTEANEGEPPKYAGAAESETIFIEDFNSGSLGGWSRSDDNAFCGEDFWGLSSRVYHTGPVAAAQSAAYSVWCSGEGDMYDGLSYDCSMSSVLALADGIDINEWKNLTLSYWVNYDTELNTDIFHAEYWFGDGGLWGAGFFSGQSAGWVRHEVSIPNDNIEPGLFSVAFNFVSNAEDEYDGVYLDDIVLTGEPRSNLTWFAPLGWSDAIVASTAPGTNESTPLFADATTYIDWAIINEGYGDAGPFWVFLSALIDGLIEVIDSVQVSSLPAGAVYTVEDVVWVGPEGEHRLFIRIDEKDEVLESDESSADNVHSEWYTWQPPAVFFSGHLYYWDMHPPKTMKPMRGVTIEMWNEVDGWFDYILAADTTDETGRFAMDPVVNDEGGSDPLDLYFKIFAENGAARITQDHNGALHKFETPHANDVSSGYYDTVFVPAASIDSSGPFYVADLVIDLRDWWKEQLNPWFVLSIEVVLAKTEDRSYFTSNDGDPYIFIQHAIDPTKFRPNTYDEDVIAHEYTHKMEWELGFFNNGDGSAHSWCDVTNPEFAACEGFAEFTPSVISGDPLCKKYSDDFLDTAWCNVENGTFGLDDLVDWRGSADNGGAASEGAVACLLWDIYDEPDDDYSTFGVYPQPVRAMPDGIGDSLCDGLANILNTLITKEIDGHLPDDIEQFWQAWFASPSPGHPQAMRDIWYEHGIDKTTCCLGIRGNVNNDPEEKVNLADISLLIDHVYISKAPIDCPEEADVNNDFDHRINLADISCLISYVYLDGCTPAACE